MESKELIILIAVLFGIILLLIVPQIPTPKIEGLSAGAVSIPSYSQVIPGIILVNDINVNLYNNPEFRGLIRTYEFNAIQLSLADHVTNYVIANYNNGNPIISVTTDIDLINFSNVVPILTIVRTGGVLHSLNWDELGLGLADKINERLIKTERFIKESGLALSITDSNKFYLSSGIVWHGVTRYPVFDVNTSVTSYIRVYHEAGNWISSFANNFDFNNTHYDNGLNAVVLTPNRYAVNWVWRGVEDQNHLYIILGTGNYTLAQAQDALVPAPPEIITSHAVLVGKIIIQKGSPTAYSVQSAFDTTFVMAGVSNHNDLTGLQGGSLGEYYHIDSNGVNIINNLEDNNFTICQDSNKLDGQIISWNDTNKCNEYVEMQGEVTPRTLGWFGGMADGTGTVTKIGVATYRKGSTFVAEGDLNFIRPFLSNFAGNPDYNTIGINVYKLEATNLTVNAPICTYNSNGNTAPLVVSSTTSGLQNTFFFTDCDLNIGENYAYAVWNTSPTPTTQYFSVGNIDYINSPTFAFYTTNGTTITYYTSNPEQEIGFTNGKTWGGHTTGYSGPLYSNKIVISDGNANIINRIRILYRSPPANVCVKGQIFDSESNVVSESINHVCNATNMAYNMSFVDYYFPSFELDENKIYYFDDTTPGAGGTFFGLSVHPDSTPNFYGDYSNGFGKAPGSSTHFLAIRVN